MCSLCHLAPGMKRTEISRGLYPRAPELRRKSDLTPAEQFWVVKHGLKMTGMPAWGVTHDDELLWDVVAFLQKLPELTADQYQTLVKSAPKSSRRNDAGDEQRQWPRRRPLGRGSPGPRGAPSSLRDVDQLCLVAGLDYALAAGTLSARVQRIRPTITATVST